MNSIPKEEVHWKMTGTPGPECSPLQENTSYDVVVVGGGLTGCRTALGLAENNVSVALLEASEIAWGASGRSGGQCNPIWRETPAELQNRFGATQAGKLIDATLTSADDLFADIAKYNVDCDPVQNGWFQTAHTAKARKALERLGNAWSQAGADITEVHGEDVTKAMGSKSYSFALRHGKGGHVQPCSLTRGYAKAAIRLGADFYAHSPVRSMERLNGKWRLATERGYVTAEQVILTTNAYTNGLWPGLQQTFYPLVSIAVATRPLTAEERATVLPNSVTFSDTRLAIYFARYDRDGRLVFGCVGSNDKVGSFGGHRRLRTGLNTVFPQLKNIELERTWAGRIAVTPEMMPHLHEPAPGVLAALGFSGRGIAMTSVMGRTLANKVLGQPESSLAFPVLPIERVSMHAAAKTLIPLAAPAMSIKDKFDTLFSGT